MNLKMPGQDPTVVLVILTYTSWKTCWKGWLTRGLMTIILVITETLSLARIKTHLSEIVDRVEFEHNRVFVTRNGRPAAILMSPEDLEALEDTLDLLSDTEALAEICRARDEVAKGKTFDAESLRAKYLTH